MRLSLNLWVALSSRLRSVCYRLRQHRHLHYWPRWSFAMIQTLVSSAGYPRSVNRFRLLRHDNRQVCSCELYRWVARDLSTFHFNWYHHFCSLSSVGVRPLQTALAYFAVPASDSAADSSLATNDFDLNCCTVLQRAARPIHFQLLELGCRFSGRCSRAQSCPSHRSRCRAARLSQAPIHH